jgi:hypothetical protein
MRDRIVLHRCNVGKNPGWPETDTLLAISRGICDAIIEGGSGWGTITYPPNTGVGLDDPITTIIQQIDGSGNPVELWIKVGSGVNDWIPLDVVRSDINPLSDGAVNPGISEEVSRVDHVHPIGRILAAIYIMG